MMETLRWNHRSLVLITRMDLWEPQPEDGYKIYRSNYWVVGEVTGVAATSGLKIVEIEVPFDTLPKGNEKGTILDYARRDGVFAQRIGLLDDATLRTHPGVYLGQQDNSTKE